MLHHLYASVAIVLAQAGGGGSFGSSGGGGSSFGGGGSSFGGGGSSFGGGSGGGDFDPVVFIIFLALVIVINVAKSRGSKQANKRITRTIRQGRKVQEEMLRTQALNAISQRDPEFDMGGFLQRSAQAFVTTQYAWSEQDLSKCRAFISDGVHERFDLYIGMQKVEGIRNRMKNVSVTNSEVVAITTDTHFDTIHVRFTASAISYNESLETGRRVSGNSDTVPITFTEIWSFSRRPGARTRADASLLQGSCPNCGDTLEIVDRARCQTCESIVNSGEYDWVLAEITQDEEWIVPPANHKVPGWSEIEQRDPGLNYQHMEDRASVIYWRSMMAVYHEDLDYAAPVLPPQARTVPPLWRPAEGNYWFTPAVGSVEVQRAIPARGEDAWDRIHVQVRWSATLATGDRRNPRMLNNQRIYTHVLILRRDRHATSNLSQTFTSFSCSSCGAPLNVGKQATCRFCGTPVNDGRNDWVLEDVKSHAQIRAYLAEQQRHAQVSGAGGVERMESSRLANEPELLVAMAKLVSADGTLHDKERQMLSDLAASRGVSEQRLAEVLEAAQEDDESFPLPSTPQDTQVFMTSLIRAALIDGYISKQEQHFLGLVGSGVGWNPRQLQRAVQGERERLYNQARQVINYADHPPPPSAGPPPPSGPPTGPPQPPPLPPTR